MVMTDVRYGTLLDHRLDIYCADDNEKHPLFVFFHGGGLEGGDKGDGSCETFRILAERGITVATADYRMYPKAHFPDYICDAALCVAWCRDNIPHSEIYVGGSSAGAYLSMMLAFDTHYLSLYGIDSKSKDDIAGFFCDSGQPTVHFNILRERGLDTRLIRVDESAPVYHISEQHFPDKLPRYDLIVSDNDIVCRLEQNRMLYRTMLQMGYPESKVKFTLMEGYSHTGYNGDSRLYSEMIENFIRQK